MSTVLSKSDLKKLILLFGLLASGAVSGCASTTTAGVQATMHADETYRLQSADVTASIQVVLVRDR